MHAAQLLSSLAFKMTARQTPLGSKKRILLNWIWDLSINCLEIRKSPESESKTDLEASFLQGTHEKRKKIFRFSPFPGDFWIGKDWELLPNGFHRSQKGWFWGSQFSSVSVAKHGVLWPTLKQVLCIIWGYTMNKLFQDIEKQRQSYVHAHCVLWQKTVSKLLI